MSLASISHGSQKGLRNNAFDRTTGSHSLAAAGQRERWAAKLAAYEQCSQISEADCLIRLDNFRRSRLSPPNHRELPPDPGTPGHGVRNLNLRSTARKSGRGTDSMADPLLEQTLAMQAAGRRLGLPGPGPRSAEPDPPVAGLLLPLLSGSGGMRVGPASLMGGGGPAPTGFPEIRMERTPVDPWRAATGVPSGELTGLDILAALVGAFTPAGRGAPAFKLTRGLTFSEGIPARQFLLSGRLPIRRVWRLNEMMTPDTAE